MSKDQEERSPAYEHKTVLVDEFKHTVGAFVAGQDPGGIRFPTGPGTIFFTYDGGPTVDFSISVSLPSPFDFISVGLSMGSMKSGITGYSVSVTDPNGYYKAYVEKHLNIKLYANYRRPINAPSYVGWELWNTTHTYSVYNKDAYAVKVG